MKRIPLVNSFPGSGPLVAELKRRDAELARAIADLQTQPVKLPSYTVATVPTAGLWPGCLIYVSDGTSNKRLAVSDGTNWRFPDGNVIS
jgi:hypothetical protein